MLEGTPEYNHITMDQTTDFCYNVSNTHMKNIHSLLVTAYLIGGLALMATTPWASLHGDILNSGGATLAVETLHGAAEESTILARNAVERAESAAASKQLMLGILIFTLGGFLHAYETVRSERPVRVTVKKRKPLTLFWMEMRIR